MKRILSMTLLCGVAAAGLSAPTFANCPSDPVALQTFSAALQCADSFRSSTGGPSTPVQVSAFAWSITNPTTVNSGTTDIACETPGTNTCIATPQSGTPDDGLVSIEQDWSTTTMVGCPKTLADPRVGVSVVGADGRGVIISTTLNPFDGTHNLDLAGQDDGAGSPLPFVCEDLGGKVAVNSIVNTGTDYQLGLKFPTPRVFSDCDPGSLGAIFGACTDNFVPSVDFGNVFWSHQPCDQRVGLELARWTSLAVRPATDGTSNVLVPVAPAGLCSYVGMATRLGRTQPAPDSSGITNFVRLAGQGAASDRALEVRAAKAQGKVTVRFRTDSELEAVSFDLVADGRVLTGSTTASRGGNGIGASYEIVVGMGDLKGAKSLAVRTNLRGGGTITSDPVSF